MGVIIDDDRPKQHAPMPVRCLEDELVRVREVKRESCVECRLSPRLDGRTRCRTCQLAHERTNRARSRWASADADWRMYTRAVANGGVVQATSVNQHIIERLIEQGRMRWGTPAELERMGLSARGNYAVIPRQ
jgi:hypothetical protein